MSLNDALVFSAPLVDTDPASLLTYRPSRSGVDLAGWAAENRRAVHNELLVRGALLFRGFTVDSAPVFEHTATSLTEHGLFGDYGDLPRQQASEKIFHSTPYPADLAIFFHNESSHMSSWPLHIFFHCAVAAEERGDTPILDCRALCSTLNQEIVEEFAAKRLTYVRTFSEGIDVPWRSFFGTSDRGEVEEQCRVAGTDLEWLPGDALRIRQSASAVRTHPNTGDRVFFNQVLLHHPAALPQATRAALSDLYGNELFPRNVTFGDGTVIADETIAYLISAYEQLAVRFRWEVGDLLMLDNMLVSHGRDPFVGARKILVAMADIIEAA